MKKVLVAGSDGYIGTVLCGLLQQQYSVTGLDTGYYRNAYLYSPRWDLSQTLSKDIRDVTDEDLQDFETVICLSDLNDPISQAFPEVTQQTNYRGPARFAELCKRAGVKRFIYSSSASVYGFADDKVMDENSDLNPLTPYAECKALMEKELQSLSDEGFKVACLRNSTTYGLSPRIRFDLLINYLCGTAITRSIIELKSDGGAWRPFVHIQDICMAFISILDYFHTNSATNFIIVNVGNGDTGNYRVIDIAKIIQELTGCEIVSDDKNKDKRSYRINSAKLERMGIKCSRDLRSEILGMLDFFKFIKLTEQDLEENTFTRLKQINYLLDTKQIDQDFFWRKDG